MAFARRRSPGGSRTIVFRTEGRGPRVQGAHARWLALALERKGLTMLVEDQSGRILAELGRGVRSPLGRLILGSSRVRPHIGAFLRSRLSHRAPEAPYPPAS